MNQPKRLARIAGAFYLLVAIFGGFAEGFAEPRMYVAGDAAATARNLVANSGLVRFAVISDLFQATIFVFVGMSLYLLLRHVHEYAARAMVVFVVISVCVMLLNAVFEYEGLRAATGAASLSALGTSGSNALVLLLLDLQHYGLLIAQIFFGLWLVPLGYLAYRSGWFPKTLSVLLVVGGACYLVDMLTAFGMPALSHHIHGFVVIPSAVAELWMVGYLLVIGIKKAKTGEPDRRVLTPA